MTKAAVGGVPLVFISEGLRLTQSLTLKRFVW